MELIEVSAPNPNRWCQPVRCVHDASLSRIVKLALAVFSFLSFYSVVSRADRFRCGVYDPENKIVHEATFYTIGPITSRLESGAPFHQLHCKVQSAADQIFMKRTRGNGMPAASNTSALVGIGYTGNLPAGYILPLSTDQFTDLVRQEEVYHEFGDGQELLKLCELYTHVDVLMHRAPGVLSLLDTHYSDFLPLSKMEKHLNKLEHLKRVDVLPSLSSRVLEVMIRLGRLKMITFDFDHIRSESTLNSILSVLQKFPPMPYVELKGSGKIDFSQFGRVIKILENIQEVSILNIQDLKVSDEYLSTILMKAPDGADMHLGPKQTLSKYMADSIYERRCEMGRRTGKFLLD